MTERRALERPRSKRMVAWLVVTPVALLLLALAGANWKVFHLAWCRHLMSSDSVESRTRGLRSVFRIHHREGMSEEAVRQLVRPLKLEPAPSALTSDTHRGSDTATYVIYLSVGEASGVPCRKGVLLRFTNGASGGPAEFVYGPDQAGGGVVIITDVGL